MATYTKLKSGEWGIRGTGAAPASGASVRVEKKSGGHKYETVLRLLWSGKDSRTGVPAWLASIAQNGSGNNRSGRDYAPGGKRCPMCGERDCPRAWDDRDLCQED